MQINDVLFSKIMNVLMGQSLKEIDFSDNNITYNALREAKFLENAVFDKVNFSKNSIDTNGGLEIISCQDIKEIVLSENNINIHELFMELDSFITESHIRRIEISK